jgi:hypothetical protein
MVYVMRYYKMIKLMIIIKYLGKLFMIYVMLMSQRRCNKMVSEHFF